MSAVSTILRGLGWDGLEARGPVWFLEVVDDGVSPPCCFVGVGEGIGGDVDGVGDGCSPEPMGDVGDGCGGPLVPI